MSDDGLEIRWRGPKEWRPYRWPGSPLLSAEENKRVGFILRESKKLIRRTAFLAPDDYAFPKYLALVHQGEQKSYATRYKETLLIENIETIRSGMHGAQLLDHSTSDQKYDAVALIRPYVRLNTADPEAVLSLRKSTLYMRVDGAEVLRTPIDEHLILSHGSFPRKNRWKLHSLVKHLFLANTLDKDWTVPGDAIEGIFCPNGSRIQIDLSWSFPGFEGEVHLTAGLVAARYTTKGSDGEPATPRTIT